MLVPPWRRRHIQHRRGRPPMRLVRSGGEVLSVTFPSTDLVSRVQIALGADLSADPGTWQWADITQWVRYDLGISLVVGRRDEATTTSTGAGVLKLDNTGRTDGVPGRFTRRNPMGPYYRLLSKNTPIWVTVDAGSGEKTRMEMYVNEWPKTWADKSATDSTVTIRCAGVLRRLAQGRVLKSPMRRAVLGAGPMAYWPLEDGSGATTAASGISGGSPMVASGTVSFGSVALPSGDAFGPDLSDSGRLSGEIASAASAVYTVEFEAKYAFDGADVPVALITSVGSFDAILIYGQIDSALAAQVVAINLATSTSTTLGDFPLAADFEGEWHHYRVTLTQSGGNVLLGLWLDGIAGTTTGPTAATLGRVSSVDANWGGQGQTITGSVAHIALYDYAMVDDHSGAVDGYIGEQAHVRIARLCGEEGVAYESSAASSPAMGPQGTEKLLTLLREAETVGGGVLYEKRWGLAYQSLAERYNAPVAMALNIAQAHLAEIPQLADDDQRTNNLYVASRTDGSEYTAEVVDGEMGTGAQGPGVYDNGGTLNVETDTQLAGQAGWRNHLGTIDEDRWPNLGLTFAHDPDLIDTWTSLPPGPRLSIASPLEQMDPNPPDLVMEGHSEHWNSKQWTANLNCSPASAYRVFVVESSDGNLGRIDSGNSRLLEDEDSTTTSLTVAGTLPWSTADSGYHLDIAGEQVTVGSVASFAADTFTRTEVNGWGTGESGGGWLTNGGAAGDYSVSGGTARHAPTAAASTRVTHQQVALVDSRSLLDIRAPALATGAEIRMGRLVRYVNISNFYHVLLCWQTDSTVDLTIWSRIGGTGNDVELERTEAIGTYASGDWWRLLVDITGSTISARAWPTSVDPPHFWHITATETSMTAGGSVGVRTFLATGNTNALPLTCEYDNNDIIVPQTFTVTRSVNGVVKNQPASVGGYATKVSLWKPGVVGL